MGEGLPDFLFEFLRTVSKFCAIICCKPLAQLKPIHALGHWVAQNIAENKKYLENVSYIDIPHSHRCETTTKTKTTTLKRTT